MRRNKHTFYEVLLKRHTSQPAIEREEWLAVVNKDADLVEGTGDQSKISAQQEKIWRLSSHPEGTPIYFDKGTVFIREDDSVTIEKLVDLAKVLQASVVGEDGTIFFDMASEGIHTATSPGGSEFERRFTPALKRVILDDERIRRRQAAIGFLCSLVLPIYTAWVYSTGQNPGIFYFWTFLSLILTALTAAALWRPKYVLEFRDGGDCVAYLANTKSTDDDRVTKRFSRSELDPIELIWFALEYPAKRITEYQVRSARNPWLVFWAGRKKEKGQAILKELGAKLRVSVTDMSAASAATNVPKKYQV